MTWGVTRRGWLGLLPGLAGCATLRATPPVTPLPSDEAFAWPSVLREAVDGEGRVDFRRLRAERGALDVAVAGIGRRAPGNRPAEFPTRADVLAFHINAYNALAMYNVVRSEPPPRLGLLDRVEFFKLTKVVVGEQEISLYDYENDVIRPLGEERVHVALNCMARSCPRLPRTPFTAEGLDAQLDAASREFFNDAKHVQVDEGRRVVRLSSILDFYPQDFLRRAPTLVAYANRYRAVPLPGDYKVEFIPYDWTLNAQPPGVRAA